MGKTDSDVPVFDDGGYTGHVRAATSGHLFVISLVTPFSVRPRTHGGSYPTRDEACAALGAQRERIERGRREAPAELRDLREREPLFISMHGHGFRVYRMLMSDMVNVSSRLEGFRPVVYPWGQPDGDALCPDAYVACVPEDLKATLQDLNGWLSDRLHDGLTLALDLRVL